MCLDYLYIMDACSLVRSSCESIAAGAQHVSMDIGALEGFASKLAAECPEPAAWDDNDVHYSDDARGKGSLTISYVMVLDTLNFSFWPSSTELEYDVLARCLRDVLRKRPVAFSASHLKVVTEDDLAQWFAPHVLPNLPTRAAFLRELGWMLDRYCSGDPLRLLKAARHSAVALCDLLIAYLPNLRDEAVYADPGQPGSAQRVFFYKRAQIMVADMWAAFGRQTCSASAAASSASRASPVNLSGRSTPKQAQSEDPGSGTGISTPSSERLHPACFYDIDRLTCFADYRIPQLLRGRGVLLYEPALAQAVDAKQMIPAGSTHELEIRACTVTAVEALRALLLERHAVRLTSIELDWRLWQIGEKEACTGDRELAKTSPHHRTDTVFY